MITLDKNSIREWCAANGLLDESGSVWLPGAAPPICYRIPGDSGKKTALAKAIALLFAGEGESALWISEYGVWPSSEDRALFNGFRKSLGEFGSLSDKPGHVFTKEDVEPARSLLAMVLYFVWGAWVVSPQAGVLVRISHDEVLELHLRNGDNSMIKSIELIGRIATRFDVET